MQLQSYERESYRPAKKVYKITDMGIERLKEWVIKPSEPGNWDEFLLMQYNSWLVDPEVLIRIMEDRKQEHDQRIKEYRVKVAALREQNERLTSENPLFSSVALIEMGILFESSCREWCDKMIDCLKKNEI
ncbi:hypothetical protein HQN90_07570 [Paenibacillus alba]|nr:hypothetical protein [Paenibacillus alba]